MSVLQQPMKEMLDDMSALVLENGLGELCGGQGK